MVNNYSSTYSEKALGWSEVMIETQPLWILKAWNIWWKSVQKGFKSLQGGQFWWWDTLQVTRECITFCMILVIWLLRVASSLKITKQPRKNWNAVSQWCLSSELWQVNPFWWKTETFLFFHYWLAEDPHDQRKSSNTIETSCEFGRLKSADCLQEKYIGE